MSDERSCRPSPERSSGARRELQLLPSLADEFDETKSGDEIRACADAIFIDYDKALLPPVAADSISPFDAWALAAWKPKAFQRQRVHGDEDARA